MEKKSHVKAIALLLMFFCLNGNLLSKTIYYVKTRGFGDGSSWASAAGNIQTMIDKAVAGDEVWVAKGLYFPTTETIARDARSRTYVLKDGVNVLGGFAGTESAIPQRALADLDKNGKIDSWEFVNATLLSGDIDGVEDVWTKTINSDGKTWEWTITGNTGNCYRVVTCQTDFTNKTNFDGFSIKGANGYETQLGGGIYGMANLSIANCTVNNCYAYGSGGGIYVLSSSVANCTISNCSTEYNGGGIYSESSSVANCTVSNCSTDMGGIYVLSSSVANCTVSNCSADYFQGGGIYAVTAYVANCTVCNCSVVDKGGGIYAIGTSTVANCAVNNCYAADKGGGIFADIYSTVAYCAASNNKTGSGGPDISGGLQMSNISPFVETAYIKPTSYIGIATTEAQQAELLSANWRLREASPCINAGIQTSVVTNNDIDGNPRIQYGLIDIGAYEFSVPTIQLPAVENFNNWTNFDGSNVLYNSATINGGPLQISWGIENQKAVFSWKTNLTSAYSEAFFTYQIDATKATNVFLRYDMYFKAYAGTITPLGTEKLGVDFSTDLQAWTSITSYSNQNGTIANKNYLHDISALAAGKTFFIRFNANGANSNRIEKWEIDNIIVDTDGKTAVQPTQEDKYKYSINNGMLIISNLDKGAFVQIYDVSGKLLNNENAMSKTDYYTLPCHGVYFITISSDSGDEKKKVVW
ncbi:right-handed parallel beta-helix repeat-containing protein [Bacteroides sedimenti]|uniref:Probable pectate lyase C n=1 Tax=Bacteroides sedimenti TaxID=2136147 RepID=A0ABN6Z5W4_9BACE